MGCILVVLLLAVAPTASARTVAQISAKLAADTQHLADARSDLTKVRARQGVARRAHGSLRAAVEARLVAIYKYGNGAEALATIASSGSVRDVGTSMETLDLVTRHEARNLRRFQRLSAELVRLKQRRAKLEARIERLQTVVLAGRARLDKANAAAARERAQLAEMARIQDSPLLPRIGHPENNASALAGDSISADQPVGFSQSGTASHYADSFTGELTANGERYDPNAFTAAHPSLPFGTWVNVRGPGGSIAVRINDRGPFIGGRIIDLSRAAAAAIGLPGIGPVTLTVGA